MLTRLAVSTRATLIVPARLVKVSTEKPTLRVASYANTIPDNMAMRSNDMAPEEYLALRPSQFPVLVRFNVEQHHVPGSIADVTLTIELRPSEPEDQRRLRLWFRGVSDLTYAPGATSLLQLWPLKISSTHEMGWESSKRYRVVETEEESVVFYCREFSSELAS